MIDGLVEDVSRSGLFMRSPKADGRSDFAPLQLGPGSSAEIDLELPEETLHLAVEVVRIEDEPRAGMALKFTPIDASELERTRMPLANFIMQQYHAR